MEGVSQDIALLFVQGPRKGRNLPLLMESKRLRRLSDALLIAPGLGSLSDILQGMGCLASPLVARFCSGDGSCLFDAVLSSTFAKLMG